MSSMVDKAAVVKRVVADVRPRLLLVPKVSEG